MMPISRNSAGPAFGIGRHAVLLAAGLLAAEAAVASDGRFHIGIQAAAADAEPEFGRVFHNRTQAVPTGLGRILRDRDEDSEALTGAGLLLGYRRTFADGLFLEVELDAAVHGGTARGRLAGVGVSPGRNQAGESWPYRWRFEKDRSFGLTLRFGGSPAFLHTLICPDSSLHLLAGIRRARSSFGYRSRGCTLGGGCTDDQYLDSDEHWDFYQTAWSFGGGLEVPLGSDLALRGELRRTRYEKHRWGQYYTDISNVFQLDMRETELALALILRL